MTGSAQGSGTGYCPPTCRGRCPGRYGRCSGGESAAVGSSIEEGWLASAASNLDIVNSQQVTPFFDDVVKDLGRLDILVNNAGLGQNVAAVVELTDQEWTAFST